VSGEYFEAGLQILDVNATALPTEMRERRQWVAWKLIKRKQDKKPTKIPYNPATGTNASTTDPTTWGTIDQALDRLSQGGYDGIGFVFAEDDPYTGIDLDQALHAETGELEAWARPIVDRFASYTEISPSKTGLHIIIRGMVPDGQGHKVSLRKTPLWVDSAHPDAAIEMYSAGRFFTMTGGVWHA
jgi:primase-polymerase (primpol)-like protein